MPFEYTPAWPHGALAEVFPDVFFVNGTNRTHFAGDDLQFSRGMLVVRERGDLTLINTVRLDEGGLNDLAALGRIAHVVRLGAFHGRDDPFYRDHFGATLWALPGAMHADGREPDRLLAPGGALPLAEAELFRFESARVPEAALLLRRAGGILVTCDAVQSWASVDRFFSPATAEQYLASGKIRAPNIPSTWLEACSPDPADFQRLLALDFRHLVSAHGEPLRDDAHARLSEAITRLDR